MCEKKTQDMQTTPAKNPFLAAADLTCHEPMWARMVGLLVTEALHRVAEMEEDELRRFLPWLLFNDGELAGASPAQLRAVQSLISSGLPPKTWPRP